MLSEQKLVSSFITQFATDSATSVCFVILFQSFVSQTRFINYTSWIHSIVFWPVSGDSVKKNISLVWLCNYCMSCTFVFWNSWKSPWSCFNTMLFYNNFQGLHISLWFQNLTWAKLHHYLLHLYLQKKIIKADFVAYVC